MPKDQEALSFERLVKKFAPECRLLRKWPLKGGISAGMTTLELSYPGGDTQKVIVRRPNAESLRQNPHAVENEFRLLRAVKSLGLAAPTPLYLDLSTPCLVIDYIEGGPEFAPAKPMDCALQLADYLASLHRTEISSLDLSFLPKHPPGCAELSNWNTSHPALEVESILSALATARQPEPPHAPALLHGDFWPGNILWRDGRLAAVIDWEDACLGNPLYDFAISRLDILWIYGGEAFHSFTHRYQSQVQVSDCFLPYWDLCAALRLARLVGADLSAWVAFFAPYGRTDITEKTIRNFYRLFTGQALTKLA